jgi:hypothetical protein
MTSSPEVGEPFDQLCRVVLVELDVRKVHLQHGRARVAHPEEHQLGLAQVHGRQRRGVHGCHRKLILILLLILLLIAVDLIEKSGVKFSVKKATAKVNYDKGYQECFLQAGQQFMVSAHLVRIHSSALAINKE